MPSLTLIRNDKNYYLTLEVREADGSLVNLTGSTVLFKLQKYGSSTLLMEKEGSVVSPGSLGLCQVYIASELVSKDGEFIAELEITWPSGKVLTAPEINVKILKDLPR